MVQQAQRREKGGDEEIRVSQKEEAERGRKVEQNGIEQNEIEQNCKRNGNRATAAATTTKVALSYHLFTQFNTKLIRALS